MFAIFPDTLLHSKLQWWISYFAKLIATFAYQHVANSVKTVVNIVAYCLLIYYLTTFWDHALSDIIFIPTLEVSASAMLVLLTEVYYSAGVSVVSSGITFIPNLMTVSHLCPMLERTHTHTHSVVISFTYFLSCKKESGLIKA